MDNDSFRKKLLNEKPIEPVVTPNRKEEDALQEEKIVNSLQGFNYVDNIWEIDTVVQLKDEIIALEKLCDSSFVCIAKEGNRLYFSEYNIEGKLLNKHYLHGAKRSIKYNLESDYKGTIYYKTQTDELFRYSSKNKKHLLDTSGKRFPYVSRYTSKNYFSPNSDDVITLSDARVDINGYDVLNGKEMDWFLENGCWDKTGTKFYFDNNGEVACIWELNLKEFTLDKIVPVHEAKYPVVFGTEVYYAEEDIVKRAIFKDKGKNISNIYYYKNDSTENSIIEETPITSYVWPYLRGYDKHVVKRELRDSVYIYTFTKKFFDELSLEPFIEVDARTNRLCYYYDMSGDSEAVSSWNLIMYDDSIMCAVNSFKHISAGMQWEREFNVFRNENDFLVNITNELPISICSFFTDSLCNKVEECSNLLTMVSNTEQSDILSLSLYYFERRSSRYTEYNSELKDSLYNVVESLRQNQLYTTILLEPAQDGQFIIKDKK